MKLVRKTRSDAFSLSGPAPCKSPSSFAPFLPLVSSRAHFAGSKCFLRQRSPLFWRGWKSHDIFILRRVPTAGKASSEGSTVVGSSEDWIVVCRLTAVWKGAEKSWFPQSREMD